MASSTATTTGLPDVEVGEHTPLLPKQPEEPEPPEPFLDVTSNSNKEKIVTGVAAVSFAMSLLTLLWADAAHPSLYASGVIGAMIAPYAAVQQHKITETDALAESNALMSEQVQLLQDENTRLQRQVQELEESVRSLQVMQETLDAVRGVEGKSISVLEQQLEESKKILNGMENSTQAEILQQLTSILLASEVGDDHDMQLLVSDRDMDPMIERLESINGVDVNDNLFRQTILQHGRSVNAVMEVIRNLLRNDIADEQRIFTIHQ